MLVDLFKAVDKFVATYGTTGSDRDKMKSDLLDLVQKAVEHGEAKDQNKITGIATGIMKSFFGKKD